jgi:hypothetical protein
MLFFVTVLDNSLQPPTINLTERYLDYRGTVMEWVVGVHQLIS